MIQNIQELNISLTYAARWADTLEGLRQQAQQTDAILLPITAAGPLSEIRRVLAEAQAFLEILPQEPNFHHEFTSGNEQEKVIEKTSV